MGAFPTIKGFFFAQRKISPMRLHIAEDRKSGHSVWGIDEAAYVLLVARWAYIKNLKT